MQTFLPYPSFERSALVLDRKRLGKQRVEAYQIARTLIGSTHGWSNHPAVRMWSGHVKSLCTYGVVMCEEWLRRGYKDTLLNRLLDIHDVAGGNSLSPLWLGDERLHSSHRAHLLMKDPQWYGSYLWREEPCKSGDPYFWPEVT